MVSKESPNFSVVIFGNEGSHDASGNYQAFIGTSICMVVQIAPGRKVTYSPVGLTA